MLAKGREPVGLMLHHAQMDDTGLALLAPLLRLLGDHPQVGTRPGKDRGVSASWDVIPGRFWVFSTSTAFEEVQQISVSAFTSAVEFT